MRTVDLVVVEIGSTTTIVSAFDDLGGNNVCLIGQGQAVTTVASGDVTVGLILALQDLEESVGETIRWQEMVASSSAAGGLRMTVHGLVHEMTVKAAREAALGAGANLHMVTAGEITATDISCINSMSPNIILLAGGVDFGEKTTIVGNARMLASLEVRAPVIFAGNVAAGPEVRAILQQAGFSVTCVDNVYPHIDTLAVEPTRQAIQRVFEEHIVEAPGMQKIRQMVNGLIIPTPGAVMRAARLLREDIGDLMVIDVGGATTDVHSVTDGGAKNSAIAVMPEPVAKRTVEGDLGVYVNAINVLQICDRESMCRQLDRKEEALMSLCVPMPMSAMEKRFAGFLVEAAVKTSAERHVGMVETIYAPTGRISLVRGKDLRHVKWIIGTGGALSRLPDCKSNLEKINKPKGSIRLYPHSAKAVIDKDYIMAAAGMMAERHPEAALHLMRKSLGLTGKA